MKTVQMVFGNEREAKRFYKDARRKKWTVSKPFKNNRMGWQVTLIQYGGSDD